MKYSELQKNEFYEFCRTQFVSDFSVKFSSFPPLFLLLNVQIRNNFKIPSYHNLNFVVIYATFSPNLRTEKKRLLQLRKYLEIVNRPGVARAVLETPLSLQ